MKADLKAAQEVVELITGGWRAQAVHTAAKLGLPDHIEAGRTTSGELAEATGAEEEGIRRLMRLLVAMGVFEGDHETGYRNTPVATALLDRPGTLRDMCLLYGEEFYTAWGNAVECFTTLTAGFELAYGKPLYSYLDGHDDLAVRFQRTMKAGNLFFDYVPEIFDFSGGKTVVDCGGGNGHLLSVILEAAPDARGALIDREHVIPIARDYLSGTIGLDRVELHAGDMFKAVPQGGDVYLFCRVLAGWSDDAVVEAFRHCRHAMAGPDSRLLVLDRTVTDKDSTVLPALWDLHLLMTNGGKHRSVDQFRTFLDRAGFDVERIAELPMETTALVAAPRASE
ncbi:methyltransferase [Streptomyces sp. NPDC059568]|uniref:methyltransferase n=1 Tax=Streptomyces sp. NPDC059568 TaxID=3346868 RepID=UPI0036A07CBA